MEVFTNRPNQLLAENRITKYRLAKDPDLNKQTVIFWCDGTTEPKASTLKQIAEYFDVSADYLIGLENIDGSKT